MDTHNWYFGLIVQENHLDDAYAWAENADRDQNVDQAQVGITSPRWDVTGPWPTSLNLADGAGPASWTPRENVPPDWSMIVDTGYAYDKDGARMAVVPPTSVLLDCEFDYLGNPNSVGPGLERYISIFLKSTKILSDPQVDDNGLTVYFMETESYEFEVRQGATFAAGTGDPLVDGPTLLSDGILLCDILVDNGAPPLNDADRDFTRTEYLVNVDLTAFVGAGLGPTSSRLLARNLQEVVWNLTYLFGLSVGALYIPLAGSSAIAGQLTPATGCQDDLGKGGQRWKTLHAQSTQLAPDFTNSGPCSLVPDIDFGLAPGTAKRESQVATARGDDGYLAEELNAKGRRKFRYLVQREDFVYSASHPGPFNYRQQLTAGGLINHNPAPYAQTLPGGFADLVCPLNGDGAQAFNDAYPLHADLDPTTEFRYLLPSAFLPGLDEAIIIGNRDALLGGFALLVFDPAGVLNPNPPTPTWWLYFWDGVAPVVWIDTTLPLTFDALQSFTFSFEREDPGSGGKLWLRILVGTALLIELDLTTPAYEPSVLVSAYDWTVEIATGPLSAGARMYVDTAELMMNRDI